MVLAVAGQAVSSFGDFDSCMDAYDARTASGLLLVEANKRKLEEDGAHTLVLPHVQF